MLAFFAMIVYFIYINFIFILAKNEGVPLTGGAPSYFSGKGWNGL